MALPARRQKLFTAEIKLLKDKGQDPQTAQVEENFPTSHNDLHQAINPDEMRQLMTDVLAPTLSQFKADMMAEISSQLAVQTNLGSPLQQATEAKEEELHEKEAELEQTEQELQLLKNEIRALSHAIQDTKREMSALVQNKEKNRRIDVVKDELGTIVASTEQATGNILEAVETIDGLAHMLRSGSAEENTRNAAEGILDSVVKVYESCNFQDLTGQRINKVVNTLKFIEERVNTIQNIWGEEELHMEEVIADPLGLDDLEKTVTRPPEEQERITQEAIDALFD